MTSRLLKYVFRMGLPDVLSSYSIYFKDSSYFSFLIHSGHFYSRHPTRTNIVDSTPPLLLIFSSFFETGNRKFMNARVLVFKNRCWPKIWQLNYIFFFFLKLNDTWYSFIIIITLLKLISFGYFRTFTQFSKFWVSI